MLTGGVLSLVTNPAPNCVLTIIEDVSGNTQDNVMILLSLLQATQASNQDLWSGVPFLLTAIWSSLKAHLLHNRYVDNILRTVLIPFLLQYRGLIFQQDNARPRTTHVSMNCLTACQTFRYPARSPDLSPIEHVWDMMGK
ncbi:transposable element Tc1 transposase [Trichonephila clavipes]|nr:transposable element Tc1 transposase [Trichonephila clavipes]